jgi:hypothetical protein
MSAWKADALPLGHTRIRSCLFSRQIAKKNIGFTHRKINKLMPKTKQGDYNKGLKSSQQNELD